MMGLTWYILGILSALSGYLIYEYSLKHPLDWVSWSGLSLGVFLILFSVAWGVGSILEGVPRAASMGLLLFGLSGIIILTLTGRYMGRKQTQDNFKTSEKV